MSGFSFLEQTARLKIAKIEKLKKLKKIKEKTKKDKQDEKTKSSSKIPAGNFENLKINLKINFEIQKTKRWNGCALNRCKGACAAFSGKIC